MHSVYIGIGSNLGNKILNCRRGIAAVGQTAGCRVEACSKFYKTEPVGYDDQDWFVNAVLKLNTCLSPEELLSVLKEIEYRSGRRDTGIRFGPRELDLDILLYDDLQIETPKICIPHPRMHQRRFVLKPLCDIDPDVVHPVLNMTARRLLSAIRDGHQRVSS